MTVVSRKRSPDDALLGAELPPAKRRAVMGPKAAPHQNASWREVVLGVDDAGPSSGREDPELRAGPPDDDDGDDDDDDDEEDLEPDDMVSLTRLELRDVFTRWVVSEWPDGEFIDSGVTFSARTPPTDDDDDDDDVEDRCGERGASAGSSPLLWGVYLGREFATNLDCQNWVVGRLRAFLH